MKRLLPLAAALLLLAGSGIVHGLWTGRWGVPADVERAAARCDQLPMTVGDWKGHSFEFDARQLAQAEVVGHCSREYVSRRTGQKVTILLICGQHGPISVHTPDVCYAGAGYVMHAPELRKAGPDNSAELHTARFAKPGVNPDSLRIFWAWSDGGPLRAPENPRLSFARSGALYKLYVIRHLGSVDEPLDNDPCFDFLKALVPELKKCLSPTP